MTPPEPTLEEKINYIYTVLRRQHKIYIFMLVIKILFFIFFLSGLLYIIPAFTSTENTDLKNKILQMFSSQVSNIAKPIVENVANDIVNQQ